MDPGGIGAVVGVCILAVVGIGMCVYDRYKEPDTTYSNPLLTKKRSFKVKNLFNHVEI
jgi:hypothetical protein